MLMKLALSKKRSRWLMQALRCCLIGLVTVFLVTTIYPPEYLVSSSDPETPPPFDGLAISIINPYQGYSYNYKGNLHDHSTNSDGADSPSVVGQWYADQSYDFYTITDHDVVTPDPAVGGILWLGNAEEDTRDGSSQHLNLIGITDPITSGSDQQRIDQCMSQGGRAFINHPIRLGDESIDDLIISLEGLAGMEIFNGRGNYNSTSIWDSVLSSGKIVWGTSNDDSHTSGDRGDGFIIVNSSSANPTRNEIITQIENGNFYASRGFDLSVIVGGNTISVSTTTGDQIRWIRQSGEIIKTTDAQTDTYTPTGDEKYVRVEILDNTGQPKAWSQPLVVIDDTNYPKTILTTPTDGGAVTRGPVTFSWQTVSDATGYAIELLSQAPEAWEDNSNARSLYRIAAAISPNGATPTFPGDTSGLDEGTYYWRIIALDDDGLYGVFSDAWSFDVPPAQTTLVTPTDTSTVAWGPVDFTWQEVSEATDYAVELLSQPPELAEENTDAPSIHRIAAAISPNGATPTFPGDTSGLDEGTYYWRIIALDDDGLYGVFSDAWSFDVPPPPRPILSSPADDITLDREPVYFTWQEVSGATDYAVELLSQPPELAEENTDAPSIHRIAAAISPNGATPTFPGDTSGLDEGTYYWRIIALDDDGLYGVFSDARSFRIVD